MENESEFREWWVSCLIFTVWVKTHGTRIVDAAPIAKKWIGQNFFRFVAYYSDYSAEIVQIK